MKSRFTLDLTIKQVAAMPDGSLLLTGYASTYGQDRDKEAVTPQSLKDAVKRFLTNPQLLFQHDPKKNLGNITKAKVDDTGLWVEAVIPPPTEGTESWFVKAFNDIKNGLFHAFSIGGIFDRVKDAITGMDLMEISVVSIPANPEALFEVVQKAFALDDAKATWSTSMVNDFPDGSFLYVEPGGEKDSDGKTTPRSLRHFPYKDSSGKVDLPHLRNALARIPQSNLPSDVKDRLTTRAQKILADNTDAEKAARTAHTTMRNHFHQHEGGTEHSHPHTHAEGEASHDGNGHVHKQATPDDGKQFPTTPTPAVGMYGDPPEGSYEDLLNDLCRAACVRFAGSYSGGMMGGYYDSPGNVRVLATYPDYCVVSVNDGADTDYYEVAYDIGEDGEPVLGELREVNLVYVPYSPATDPGTGVQLSFQPKPIERDPKSVTLGRNWATGDGTAIKAGRMLSKVTESALRAAMDTIAEVLDRLEAAEAAAEVAKPAT